MSTVNNTKDRTPLKDLFFYEVTIDNGVTTIHAYPIFDQDISRRSNLDTKHSVHTTIYGQIDIDEDTKKIVDVAFISRDTVNNFGFSGDELWDEAMDALDELGLKLKEQGHI